MGFIAGLQLAVINNIIFYIFNQRAMLRIKNMLNNLEKN